MFRSRLAAFFLLACHSWAAISYVTGCSAVGTTSCTLSSTPQFGDLMIAVCGDTTTACTLPSGWTSIISTTATRSLRTAYRFALGTETTISGFTTGTGMYVMVYRGGTIGSASNSVPYGGTATATATSTTISYNTITMTIGNGTSWVIGCAWTNGATAADVAPSGMTLRSGTGTPAFACSDTNGGVSSWSTTTVTSINATSVAWRSDVVEILAAPASTGINSSNYFVSQTYTAPSGESCTSGCTLTVPVTTSGGSGANNYLQLAVVWGYSSTPPTISSVYCNADTGHATWAWTDFGHDVLDTADLTDGALYYIAGAAAGCKSVSVVFATALYAGVVAHYLELRQIAMSSPIDTAIGATATTSPNYTAGAFTPGTSGDVIYQFCSSIVQNAGFLSSTGIFAGNGATLLAPDISFAIGAEAFVQTTAAAVSPYLQVRGYAGNEICMAIALKTSNGTGTASTGVQVISQQEVTTGTATTANFESTVFNAGDTFMIFGTSGSLGGTSQQLTGISDGAGNTWDVIANAHSVPNAALDSDAKAGNDYVSLTGTTTGGSQNWLVLEISGANNTSHTSSYDSTMGLCYNSGGASPYSSAPGSCTPSTSTGVVLAMIIEGLGPTTAVTSPGCAIFAFPTYTGQTDSSLMTEGGGFSTCYGTAGTQSYTWTNPNSSSWAASAIAIKATPASAAACTLTLIGVGRGC